MVCYKRFALSSVQRYQRYKLGIALTAVRSTPVTLPLVGDEVGEVVLKEHAGGRGVAPEGGGGGGVQRYYVVTSRASCSSGRCRPQSVRSRGSRSNNRNPAILGSGRKENQ